MVAVPLRVNTPVAPFQAPVMPLALVKFNRSSPATNPAVMATVAPSRLLSSGSVRVTVPSITVAASPSVKARLAPAVTVARSLTGVTVTVLVAAALASAPSSTTKERVRAPTVGLSPARLA